MGCCQSRGQNGAGAAGGAAAHGAASGSNAAQGNNDPQRAQSDSIDPATGGPRPNQPLRNPSPAPRSPKNVSNIPPPWTRSHLYQERINFWETRVSGRQEIWGALRQAVEMLRAGDLKGAQTFLDAANITCPSGRLVRGRGRNGRGGVFDPRGKLYDIPDWVVVDPQDILEDAAATNEDNGEDGLDVDEEAARRKAVKGKGRAASLGEEMIVKVRCSDNTDFEITFRAKQNVSAIVDKVKERRGDQTPLSLIWRGKKINENETLEAQGWVPGTVLSAFLKVPTAGQSKQQEQSPEQSEL